MTEEGDIPEGDDLLAAEYALGLLSEEESAAVESRLDGDAAFRDRVVFWHEHFAGITDTIADVEPSGSVWRRIQAALPRPAATAPSRPAPPPRHARTPRRERPARVGLWRGAAALATAAAVAMGALHFTTHDWTEGPLYAGEVRAEDASQLFVVAYEPATGTLRLARSAGGAAPERSLELWAIHEGQDPVSLAVLPDEERFVFVVPEPLRARFDEATLAITDEPLGGAPAGLPTGPVIAVGGVTRL